MRLKPEEIERIVDRVLTNLKSKNLIKFKTGEEKVRGRMVELFTQNILEEDNLDKETEEILKKFQAEIDSGKVDYRKMFLKVKSQLAKERNFVL